jgi:3-hydroxyisobutyrate dehydrogenase
MDAHGSGRGERIGFIGLGRMGAPMCRRLLLAGFEVCAFDLRDKAVQAAASDGARPAGSAADCAAAADVLVTMLPGAAEVEEVLLGAGGALAALAEGSLVIDMATSTAASAQRVAAAAAPRGIGVLDAPVGDAQRAAEGMLQIAVGGDARHVARARPVLEALGDPERIVHVGPNGAGFTVKLLANLQWLVHAVAATEALAMGARAGLDVRLMHRVFTSGPARCSFLEHEALEVLADGAYGERFPLGRVAEDLQRALALADETGVPAPLAGATAEIYDRAREHLGDGAGEMGVVRLYEELTGTLLRFGDGAG